MHVSVAVVAAVVAVVGAINLPHNHTGQLLYKVKEGDVWLSVLNVLQHFEDNLPKTAYKDLKRRVQDFFKALTLEEKVRLENAVMDILRMINDHNFHLYSCLEDLHTVKTVVKPHLDETYQQSLDSLEKIIIRITKFFGMA